MRHVMYKLTILFKLPTDLPRFEREWANSFVPLVESMPGVLRIEVSTIDGGPEGPAPFYKIHELYFTSRAEMDEAMNSHTGMRAGYTLNLFAKGLFTILFAEALEDIVRPAGRPPEALEPTPPSGSV